VKDASVARNEKTARRGSPSVAHLIELEFSKYFISRASNCNRSREVEKERERGGDIWSSGRDTTRDKEIVAISMITIARSL